MFTGRLRLSRGEIIPNLYGQVDVKGLAFQILDAPSSFSVTDLYGIRASLVGGGEIQGSGNVWTCPEGEMDDTAIDMSFFGNLSFDEIMHHYLPGYLDLVPFKFVI